MPMDMASIVGWPYIRVEANGRKYGDSGLECLRIHYTDRKRNIMGYGNCPEDCCVDRGSGDITIHLTDLAQDADVQLARDLCNAAERIGGEGGPIREAYKALRVIAETPAILEWMEANDPQAMRQIRHATVQLEQAASYLNAPF